MTRTVCRTLMTFFAMLLPVLWLAGGAGAQTLTPTATRSLTITNGLVGYWRADTGAFLDNNGTLPIYTAPQSGGNNVYGPYTRGTCPFLSDLSGSGNDFKQATAALQPLFADVLGVSNLSFPSATVGMASPLTLTSPSPFTIACVYSATLLNSDAGSASMRIIQGSNSWLIGPYNYITCAFNGSAFLNGLNYPVGTPVVQVVTQSATTLTQYVNGQVTGSEAAGNWPGSLYLGYNGTAGDGASGCRFYAAAVYNRVLSAAEAAQVSRDLVSQIAYKATVICVGDSITQGVNTTAGQSYPLQVRDTLARREVQIVNFGVGGSTVSGILNAAANQTNYFAASCWGPTAGKRVVVVFAGTNDINSSASAATTYSNLQALCGVYRPHCDKIIVVTMLPRGDGKDAVRISYNASIRSGYLSFADALCDLGSDTVIGQTGQQTDTTYFSGDGTHPSSVGYTRISSDLLPVLVPLLPSTAIAMSGGQIKRGR